MSLIVRLLKNDVIGMGISNSICEVAMVAESRRLIIGAAMEASESQQLSKKPTGQECSTPGLVSSSIESLTKAKQAET